MFLGGNNKGRTKVFSCNCELELLKSKRRMTNNGHTRAPSLRRRHDPPPRCTGNGKDKSVDGHNRERSFLACRGYDTLQHKTTQTNKQTNEQSNKQTNEQTNERTNGITNETNKLAKELTILQTNEWTNERTNERTIKN